MKRLIWMIFITLLAAGVAAQTKVVERSAKKVPGWLNTAVEDYLVVSVTAGSLAEGQTKALTEITERIIQVGSSNVTVFQEEYSFGSQCEWKHRIFGCFYADIQDKVCQSSFSERDFPFQCRRNLLGESPGQSYEKRTL
mgnify:CR=1 FL=1